MADERSVLVLGATGKVGGGVLRSLVGAPGIRAIAGVRRLDGSDGLRAMAADVRRVDLDDASSLGAALEGVDGALLLTGYTVDMLRQSKRFLDAAQTAGVRHIVHVGASGAATNEVAHWGWHQFVERYVEALDFRWTHLRPESFMQNLTGFGWLRPGTLASYIGAARWSWVDCDDVAAVATAALADPDAHAGRCYRLGVEAATMAEVAEMLTTALGTAVRVEQRDPGEMYDAGVAAGGDPAYLACVLNQFRLNIAGAIADADAVFGTVADVLGRPAISWREHIRRNRAGLLAGLS